MRGVCAVSWKNHLIRTVTLSYLVRQSIFFFIRETPFFMSRRKSLTTGSPMGPPDGTTQKMSKQKSGLVPSETLLKAASFIQDLVRTLEHVMGVNQTLSQDLLGSHDRDDWHEVMHLEREYVADCACVFSEKAKQFCSIFLEAAALEKTSPRRSSVPASSPPPIVSLMTRRKSVVKIVQQCTTVVTRPKSAAIVKGKSKKASDDEKSDDSDGSVSSIKGFEAFSETSAIVIPDLLSSGTASPKANSKWGVVRTAKTLSFSANSNESAPSSGNEVLQLRRRPSVKCIVPSQDKPDIEESPLSPSVRRQKSFVSKAPNVILSGRNRSQDKTKGVAKAKEINATDVAASTLHCELRLEMERAQAIVHRTHRAVRGFSNSIETLCQGVHDLATPIDPCQFATLQKTFLASWMPLSEWLSGKTDSLEFDEKFAAAALSSKDIHSFQTSKMWEAFECTFDGRITTQLTEDLNRHNQPAMAKSIAATLSRTFESLSKLMCRIEDDKAHLLTVVQQTVENAYMWTLPARQVESRRLQQLLDVSKSLAINSVLPGPQRRMLQVLQPEPPPLPSPRSVLLTMKDAHGHPLFLPHHATRPPDRTKDSVEVQTANPDCWDAGAQAVAECGVASSQTDATSKHGSRSAIISNSPSAPRWSTSVTSPPKSPTAYVKKPAPLSIPSASNMSPRKRSPSQEEMSPRSALKLTWGFEQGPNMNADSQTEALLGINAHSQTDASLLPLPSTKSKDSESPAIQMLEAPSSFVENDTPSSVENNTFTETTPRLAILHLLEPQLLAIVGIPHAKRVSMAESLTTRSTTESSKKRPSINLLALSRVNVGVNTTAVVPREPLVMQCAECRKVILDIADSTPHVGWEQIKALEMYNRYVGGPQPQAQFLVNNAERHRMERLEKEREAIRDQIGTRIRSVSPTRGLSFVKLLKVHKQRKNV